GRPDAGNVGALLVVHGDGGAVEAAAQGGGEIGVRQHAVADGERVAGQEPLGAGPDAALCVECGDRDSGDAVVAMGAEHGVAGEAGHAVPQQPDGVPGGLGELAGEGAAVPREAPGAGGLDDGGDGDTGGGE